MPYFIMILFIVVLFAMVTVRNFIKKSKESKEINSVQDFHNTYTKKREEMEQRKKDRGKTTYVTKYNSTVDYYEKHQ